MTTNEAQRVLAVLTAAWPREQVTEATARVWLEHLRDINAEAGMTAAQLIVKNGERFPTISAFRRAALEETRRKRDSVPRLGLPPLTEAERQVGIANARKAKAILAGLKKSTTPPYKQESNA